MKDKTAAELIAKGYRLYWVDVRKRIHVLTLPGEIGALDEFTAERWARDDSSDWSVIPSEMRMADKDDRDSLPFCEEELSDSVTIGALLDAQKGVGG